MLTNNVPQCEDIVQARGSAMEGSRLPTAPSIVKSLMWFYISLLYEGRTSGTSLILGAMLR